MTQLVAEALTGEDATDRIILELDRIRPPGTRPPSISYTTDTSATTAAATTPFAQTNGAASQWPLDQIRPSGVVPVVAGGGYEEHKEMWEVWWKHHQAFLNELRLTLVVHHPACYVTAGTFTRRESGDRSARTKQEGKGSECKLRRVT